MSDDLFEQFPQLKPKGRAHKKDTSPSKQVQVPFKRILEKQYRERKKLVETKIERIELDDNQIKDAIYYLETMPGDLSGAAKEIGVSRDQLKQFIDANPHRFVSLDEEYYDRLEALCRLKAAGKPMPPGCEDFDFNRGFKILQAGRETIWKNKGKATSRASVLGSIPDSVRKTAINEHFAGEADKLIKEHLTNQAGRFQDE